MAALRLFAGAGCWQVLVLSALLVVQPATGNGLFDSDEVLDVKLTGPIGQLLRHRDKPKERPFVLSVGGVDHPVDVRVRGKSRLRVCKFAPLRLNFPAVLPEGSVFSGQDKLKLITHCFGSGRSETDVLEEYLSYRIFNLLQEASYRVRLMRISYVDAGSNGLEEHLERYGFLLESSGELAQRIGATEAKLTGLPIRLFDGQKAAPVFVFQYLIGNTDWSLVKADDDDTCCHNIDLFEKDGSLALVPYDFDLVGLVNARYAFPDPSLRLRSVTQRLYRGRCMERDHLVAGLRHVASLEGEVRELVRAIPGFSQEDIDSRIDYLEGFFKQARDEEGLIRSFERRCK